MSRTSLEVFQELHLISRSPSQSIRDAILAEVLAPWAHDREREEQLRDSISPDTDAIVLARDAVGDIPAAGLVMWAEADGYRLANIVPRDVGELSISQYNEILHDFVEMIARPAARPGHFEVVLSEPQQTMEAWIGAGPAEALRRFSAAANKSSRASHPKDRQRWLDFIVETHRSRQPLDAEQLARWLNEVHGWDLESAHDLARDFEFASEVLTRYDRDSE